MQYFVLTCDTCGHHMRVPEYAMGSRGRCACCRKVLIVSGENTTSVAPSKGHDRTSEKTPTRALPPPAYKPVAKSFVEPAANEIVRPKDFTCTRCGNPFRGDRVIENVGYLLRPTLIVASFGLLPYVGGIFAALTLYAWFNFEFRALALYFPLHVLTSFLAWHGAVFVVGIAQITLA